MDNRHSISVARRIFMPIGGIVLALAISHPLPASAQDPDRGREGDRNRDRVTTILPGTMIPVRLNETMDVDRSDNRVFTGTVDQDVRGNDGRLAIPRGTQVELMVRVARDNDLTLYLDSVTVDGERYAIKAQPNRQASQSDNSLIGSIVGAISGQEVQGRAVRLRRDTVVTFRINRSLDMGVADRGYTRDGAHYHGEPSRDDPPRY